MQIDLTKTKIVCISLKNSTERRNNFIKLAEQLNFKNWSFYDGVETGDHIEGCALSQINVLNDNLNDESILIMEDDVCNSQYYQNIVDVPADSHAIYFGYSNWAADPIRAKMSMLEPASVTKKDNFYQIKNVTSAHAILYISKKYKEACATEAKKYLYDPLGNRHCDVVYAKLQNKFNVYATPQPYFYQNCPRNKMWTETPIELP